MRSFPLEERERRILDYASFRADYDQRIAAIDRSDVPDTGHLRLNYQRMKRWERTYTPSEQILRALSSLPAQHWVVIAEDWCADVAQNLPMLARWAEETPQLRLSIVYRDENPDLMDLVLTNGSRSIPKLVALNADNGILFEWGPRPTAIQKRFYQLKDEGLDKSDIMPEVHKEYAMSKGKALEEDMLNLLYEHVVV